MELLPPNIKYIKEAKSIFLIVVMDHIVRRPLKEAFLASKIVILDYFSRELPFSRGEIDNSRLS